VQIMPADASAAPEAAREPRSFRPPSPRHSA
jgi:hypothetical protein